MKLPHPTRSSLWLSALLVLALGFMLWRSGPLYGTIPALILTVLAQVWLPGVVVARRSGRLAGAHPILQLAWVLACGLGTTIVLGGAARLFNVPVADYLLGLYGLLLVLALWGPGHPAEATAWRFDRRQWPLYLLLGLCCAIVFGISQTNRYRFHGFEDQVIFVSQAGWLANNPGETPADKPLRARMAGGLDWADTRFDTDGWTYNHAAWVWASGTTATDLIWFHLDALFIWCVPLLTFALAYALSRREDVALWSAAALTLLTMLTLDNLQLYPSYTAYGRLSALQISTLRQMSLTLMLPLTLTALATWLRSNARRDLLLMAFTGLALGLLHPIPQTIFIMAALTVAVLDWLAQPGRALLRRRLPLLLVIVMLLTLPFIQRLNRRGFQAVDSLVQTSEIATATADNIAVVVDGDFIILTNLPLIGDTVVRNPATFFYYPLIAIAVVLGLACGLGWRRGLMPRYLFVTTALTLLLSFTPGLTDLYNKVVSSVGVLTTFFMLPLPLALGYSMARLLERLPRPATWLSAGGLITVFALLIIEPFPIPGSTRAQITTYNAIRSARHIRPGQTALIDTLNNLLDHSQTSVIMVPQDSASLVIEDLPRTLITGGRHSINRAGRGGDNRFFNQAAVVAPWLDSADLAYMAAWDVTHIITQADSTRAAQLLLDDTRFSLLAFSGGYDILAQTGPTTPDTLSDLYAEMNALYATLAQPRWGPQGFALVRPGDATLWQPIVAQWQTLYSQQPDDARVRLGLAFSLMMAGDDAAALEHWRVLAQAHPQQPLFLLASAYTHAILGDDAAGATLLLDALESPAENQRVLAARALLSETFFHLLDTAQSDAVLNITMQDATAWDMLADFDQPDAIRQRAALLLNAQRWVTARDWLSRIPAVEISPADVVLAGQSALAQGDTDAALAIFEQANDPDFQHIAQYWHADRWQTNTPAYMAALLRGDIAMQAQDYATAQQAYQQAITLGAEQTGHYFLAQALEAAGDSTAAAQALLAYVAHQPDDALTPQPLLTLSNAHRLHVADARITQDENAATVSISATYTGANPEGRTAYPIRFWRVDIISVDGSQHYASIETPAQYLEQSPVRATVTLALPADVPPLTPALAVITPAYDNRVTAAPLIVPFTLHRPDAATPPADALRIDARFGEHITLENYTLSTTADALTLGLYWQTTAPLPADYQLFVHVVDAQGQIIGQVDSAPVDGRYPTSQWRPNTLIADTYTLPVTALPEDFSVWVGWYRLDDLTRLDVLQDGVRNPESRARLYAEG